MSQIIKFEKNNDKLIDRFYRAVKRDYGKNKEKKLAEKIIHIFRENREALFFCQNICVKYDPMQLFFDKERLYLASSTSGQGVVALNSRLSVSEDQGTEAEGSQLSSSEGLEAAINDPQPSPLEAQEIVVKTQPSTPKANRHLLCCFSGFFVRKKGNTEQYELRSRNKVEDLSPSIPEQQETMVEVSQPSTSKQEETIELEKQEAAVNHLWPNTPTPEEQEDEDLQPDNTVRGLLSERSFLYSKSARKIVNGSEIKPEMEA